MIVLMNLLKMGLLHFIFKSMEWPRPWKRVDTILWQERARPKVD